MASKALKGLTIKIGGDTSGLLDALKDVEKRSSSLSSELGQINKLLKLDPKNTELLAQKQKVLAEAISNTEQKLGTLKEAEKEAQEQFEKGEISEQQYRALRREIIATEKKLNGYREAAEDTNRALKNLADGADDAADEIDETEKESEEAEEAVESLGDKAKRVAKNGFMALATAAAAAVTAIVGMAEASRDYRKEMGKLETAFSQQGHASETATKTYKELQSVLGETEQAVEAANHMAMLCDTEEDLTKWTDIATGVYATFGASLPIEGLAEAANETMRAGEVTGPLADALNWAAKEGETFGVKMKAATKENEEWNKAVEAATTAEDFFNLALQECSSEQERQQLITKTLTEIYGDAAKEYKETNKEVIRANEANEKWNETVAEIGEVVEPLVTDIKEMGIALLEWAAEPMEAISNFIRTKLLPIIKKVFGWVADHLPEIAATISGIVAAIIAYKAAVFAANAITKIMTAATIAQTAAQKALNAVMMTNPWGLLAGGIAGLVTGLGVFSATTEDATEDATNLADAEWELVKASKETAEAFRDQRKATDDALANVTAQYDNVERLADELFTLADASGKVKKEDQARAQFIIDEMNKAMGTEIEMVDGIILKYGELNGSIEEVIKTKRANALLDALSDDYAEAVNSRSEAYKAEQYALADYEAQAKKTEDAIAAAEQAFRNYMSYPLSGEYTAAYMKAQEQANEEKAILEKKVQDYNDALAHRQSVTDTILRYEEAVEAAVEGNYQKTVELLSKKGETYVELSDTADEEKKRVVNTLFEEAVLAGEKAQFFKEQFEKGVDGYTKGMVLQAERDYDVAMKAFENAYADAESVGEDMTAGMTDGAENKRSSLVAKARSLVSSFLSAARKEAEIKSPSRKTREIGEYLGEGAEIGIEDKTEDIEKAAQDQMAAVLDAYNPQELAGQRAVRSIADQQSARISQERVAASNASAPMLEKILTAIEKGQVLTIDGNTLVGATASKMDNALGRRRDLAARGAI